MWAVGSRHVSDSSGEELVRILRQGVGGFSIFFKIGKDVGYFVTDIFSFSFIFKNATVLKI